MPGPDAAVLANQDQLRGHAHSGISAHNHGLATHKHFHEQDPGWLSFVLRSAAPQQTDTLQAALIEVAKAEPMLRSKGFIRTAEPELGFLVQAVRTRVAISVDTATPDAQSSELVFIGYHLSRHKVAAQLSELTGTQWK